MSQERWSKDTVFSLIYLCAGMIGGLLTIGWLFLSNNKNSWTIIASFSLLILFIVVSVAGGQSFRESLTRERFSLKMQSYHRANAVIASLIWLIFVPALLGLGLGQFFVIASGFVFFALPSFAILFIQKISLLPQNHKKTWHQWMKENALDESLKE
ncbi:hypothetical protein PVA45_01060 [Entomospira entomophila]|uniref:Uncharacterized protein n=1 Tax=Entomospira entomophila TaxID=2719988 RepID=A0A968KQT3_9SPIO|nr:hypothetical protein [Entomospira entomophilus]NIZ40109.1 hypothetical protein [Entomospira entomophilus]WDI35669.1 hypothetical protein PVA45_01060 [Entomospira entomophilus]